MQITRTYKYRLNNTIYIGFTVPNGAELIQTMDILNAENGLELLRKSDNKRFGSSVWLKDGDTQDNYEEVERREREVKNAERRTG